jgi:hypothetical protein
MKGIVVFYINFHPEYQQDVQTTIDTVLKANAALLEKIHKESDYQVMVVPTTKEACRVEKIDFDKPFPRYLPRTHFDLAEFDKKKLDKAKEKEKEKERQEKERLEQEKKALEEGE